MTEKIAEAFKAAGMEMSPDTLKGYVAYHRALRTFMIPLTDRIKDSKKLLAGYDVTRFIMAIAEELDNRKHRIEELERLVDLLSEDG